MSVHGDIGEHARQLAAGIEPYRQILVRLPVGLLRSLEEHIVNRVHEGEPPVGLDMAAERDAILALAVRAHIDYWPDLGPPEAYTGRRPL